MSAALDRLSEALADYEARDNTNYYGRLFRLQVELFSSGPALLAVARAAEEWLAAKEAFLNWHSGTVGAEHTAIRYKLAEDALSAALAALEAP